MKRILFGIFICFCSILIMSHNTFAEVSYNQNLVFIKRLTGNSLYYSIGTNVPTWVIGTQVFGRGQGTNYFRFTNSTDSFQVYNHQVIVLTGSFYATSSYATTFNTSGLMYISDLYLNCPILDMSFDTTQMQNETGSVQITYRQPFTVVCEMAGDATRVAMNLALQNDSPVSSNIGVSFSSLTVFEKDTTLSQIYSWLQNNSDSAGDTLKQEKQDVQDATDNSQSAGDSSQSSAEGATTSLLDVFGGFVSAITSASASNCVFNAPINTYLMPGHNLNVDLCSFEPPAALQALFSIVAILIVVPFAISMFNKFIGIIGSFQNG